MRLKDEHVSYVAHWLAKHSLDIACFMILVWRLTLSFHLHLEASFYRIFLQVMTMGVKPMYVKVL
jgi:hypothetical protein